MCSVLGFVSPSPTAHDHQNIQSLFQESKLRGLHAFGFTVLKDGELITKRSTDFQWLMDQLFVLWPFRAMVGHCRYSTSGDWRDEQNNQPLTNRFASMVFNGVISMKSKAEMEHQFGVKMPTDNDGWIALHAASSPNDTADFVRWMKRGPYSFAGIFLERDRMFAFRNPKRPLWVATARNSTFIASTEDIFRRAGLHRAESLPPWVAKEFDWR